jgi:hypothetical protein
VKTRLLAGGLLAALALTGCGDNSAARGDTAARVGDERITTERVADYVQQVREEPLAADVRTDLASFQRDVLGLLINAEAVDIVCRREGVVVTDAQVLRLYDTLVEQQGGEDALLQKAASEGLDRELLLKAQRSRAQQQALGRKLTEDVYVDPAQLQATYEQAKDSFDEASISQIVLASPAEANALLPQARGLDDEEFKALATERTTQESSKATGGVLSGLLRSSFTQAGQAAYGEAVFGSKAGDTFVVSSGSDQAYLVRTLSRTTTTLEQAMPRLREALLGDQIQAAVTAELASVPVRLNPRFGTWDPETTSIVSPDGSRGRPLSIPKPTATPSSLGTQEGLPAAP